jgi:hypothetical protein
MVNPDVKIHKLQTILQNLIQHYDTI